MPMRLPDLRETHCDVMRLCGLIETKSKKTIHLLHTTTSPLVARYHRNGREIWVFLVFGSGSPARKTNHFHIELLRRPEYRSIAPNANLLDEHELQARLEPMLGKRIDVSVYGAFSIPCRRVTELSLAHNLVVEYQKAKRKRSGRVMVRTEYEIGRGPTQKIVMELSPDRKNVLVELKSQLVGKIAEDYLQYFLGKLEFSYLINVRGEFADAFTQEQS